MQGVCWDLDGLCVLLICLIASNLYIRYASHMECSLNHLPFVRAGPVDCFNTFLQTDALIWQTLTVVDMSPKASGVCGGWRDFGACWMWDMKSWKRPMTHDSADTPLAPHTYSYSSHIICQIVQCQSRSNVNPLFHMSSHNHRCREDRRASCLKVKNSY